MSERLDCVVIGGGAVGLAVGRSLAIAGRGVIVLEREPHIGMHTSSRNSEVIHAGIYYPDNSRKARFCVEGKAMLYGYCAERGIPFNRIGKLIVASSENELERLAKIEEQAKRNGVFDLRFVDVAELRSMEPAVSGFQALFSPSTGIIDSHAYMLALQGDIEAHGGTVLCNSEVREIQSAGNGFEVELADVHDEKFRCNVLINSAGHDAHRIADGIGSKGLPTVQYAKGHYFAYAGKSPFNHLVYPIPEKSGLGIHATNDMSGAARFGPDVTWIDEFDYAFDESRKPAFVDAIRRYFPGLDEEKLTAAYTGIRPKLSGPGEPPADFMIQGERDHGVRGLVNLFGIESPGLTASLAIAEYVKNLVRG